MLSSRLATDIEQHDCRCHRRETAQHYRDHADEIVRDDVDCANEDTCNNSFESRRDESVAGIPGDALPTPCYLTISTAAIFQRPFVGAVTLSLTVVPDVATLFTNVCTQSVSLMRVSTHSLTIT